MSTLPQQSTIRQYIADGVEDTFIYDFLIPISSDIAVYVTPDGQQASTLVDYIDPSQYTVTGAGVVAGGTVIFNVAPAVNDIVTLIRNVQLTLTTNFAAAQNFTGANLDTALQRLLLQIQEMQGNYNVNNNGSALNGLVGSISRCLQYPADTFIPDLPNPQANVVPLLTNIDNQVWISQGGAIVAAVLQNDDMSTLRSQLADESLGGAGSTLVGFYDTLNNVPQTVYTFLNNIPTFLNNLGYATATDLQSDFAVAADDTGAVDAIVITLVPALASYVDYNRIFVRAANTNTGPAVIEVNGLGPVDIVNPDGTALVAGEILADQIIHLVFDLGNIRYQLINPFPRKATTAEVSAGTDTAHPITPAGLKAGFPLGAGTVTLPGGLILKYGTTPGIATDSSSLVTFGTPFPTAILFAGATATAASDASAIIGMIDTLTVNGFLVRNSLSSSGVAVFTWMAIGH